MRAPIHHVEGPVAVLQRDDIDTDALYPGQYLKTTLRSGLRAYLFADWVAAGHPDAAFVTAPVPTRILLAPRNFGCGSSREHAVWALADYGIAAIVALSFGDIFRNNCGKNGIVAATVSESDHAQLVTAVRQGSPTLSLDVAAGTLAPVAGMAGWPFTLAPGHRQRLLSGEDDITQTLRYTDALDRHEARLADTAPWLVRMD